MIVAELSTNGYLTLIPTSLVANYEVTRWMNEMKEKYGEDFPIDVQRFWREEK